MGGNGSGVKGEGCRFDLQEEWKVKELLESAEKDERAQHLWYIYWCRSPQRGGQVGWRLKQEGALGDRYRGPKGG